MISVTDLRAGTTFKDSQGIWEVVSYSHIKMGRGGATIRLKAKNLKTGTVLEKTFNSGQKVDEAEQAKRRGQFLYAATNEATFMDPVTFEQFSLARSAAAGKESFLKEGDTYDLVVADGEIIGIEIPNLIAFKVAETGPGVKGDSVSSVTKDAVLENGLNVKVPLFIKPGDNVRIDTRTGEYVERVR